MKVFIKRRLNKYKEDTGFYLVCFPEKHYSFTGDWAMMQVLLEDLGYEVELEWYMTDNR